MNNLRSKTLFQLVLILMMLVVIGTSCEKDDEVNPDYVGTWVAIEQVPTETGYTQVKDIMTLTETSFIDLGQLYNSSTDMWIDYLSMKGSISISGNSMNITITELGISSVDMITGLPTGIIINYEEGSNTFDIIVAQSGQPTTFTSQFSVSGNELTIKTDLNGDGDYLDENETTIYTKQE